MANIASIERIWVDLPFKPVPARNMIREIPHWTIFEICRITLDTGEVGIGETMPFYTWGTISPQAEQRAMGADPARIMWDDSLGAGLQMACFDAVGRRLGIPCFALLGRPVRERAHVGWWAIDMPAEDWIAECQEAIASGYTSLKTKARPWFDLEDQIARLCEAVPEHFRIDLDFNDFGLDPAIAKRVCKALEAWPQIAIWESPIRQEDVLGNLELRRHLDVPIAHHVGRPQFSTQLLQDICDGFVLNEGVSGVMQQAAACAVFNKPFWMQWVGTGITFVFCLHAQAVQSHARWPAINCNHMYQHQLLKTPIKIKNGLAEIPNGPGLGVELDWDAVERYRITPKPKPYPYPGLLLRLDWPSGATTYFSHAQQLWEEFQQGRLPAFVPGVNLVRVLDDGSASWKELYQRACLGPVHE